MTLNNLLKYLLVLVIILLAGWYFMTYEKVDRTVESDLGACNEPLSYRIGEIDSRFGISEEEVKEAMQMAVSLWSDAIDRPVAFYTEDGNIDVRFVYDERQEVVVGEMRFREQIESEQIRTDQIQREYETRRDRFEQKSSEYERLASTTRNELNELNRWVREKNQNGGMTVAEEQLFLERKEEVESMQQRVLDERNELDQLADEINSYVDRLNNRIEESNELVDRYNEEYSGESRFTKATYRNTESGGMITVNQYLSKRDLYMVLAHELGHALGLVHGNDPASVMYSQMGNQEIYPIIQLSREDKRAIADQCR